MFRLLPTVQARREMLARIPAYLWRALEPSDRAILQQNVQCPRCGSEDLHWAIRSPVTEERDPERPWIIIGYRRMPGSTELGCSSLGCGWMVDVLEPFAAALHRPRPLKGTR